MKPPEELLAQRDAKAMMTVHLKSGARLTIPATRFEYVEAVFDTAVDDLMDGWAMFYNQEEEVARIAVNEIVGVFAGDAARAAR